MSSSGDPVVVHILKWGWSQCGKYHPVTSWEKGHKWVPFYEPAGATCAECIRVQKLEDDDVLEH